MADSNLVSSAKPKKIGAISRAPLGTPLPTDTVAALNAAFKNLGYISEDGISNENKFSSDSIKAWGGDVVEESQTEKTDRFKFKLIESLNPDVLKTTMGDENVTGDLSTGLTIKVNSQELTASCYAIEVLMKNNVLKRMVIPNGKIVELAEVKYKTGELVGYELTISCLPDETGNTHYEYIKGGK